MAFSHDGVSDQWRALAQTHWLNTTTPKVRPETLKTEIWDVLQAEASPLASLASLENLQILERFLWPTYSDAASNHHVLLIAAVVNFKQRGRLQNWDLFADRPDNFTSLFRRILSLNLDSSLPHSTQLTLLGFVVGAYQCLEKDFIRKECAPLVSVAIWHNIHSDPARDGLLDSRAGLRKAWRAAQRRYDAADEGSQARLRFDRAWLYSTIVGFCGRINSTKSLETAEMLYCERFVEFLTDLISQLPTRRYSHVLIKDLNLVPLIRNSSLWRDDRSTNLRGLCHLLQHFSDLDVEQHAPSAETQSQYRAFAKLQRAAMKHFPEKLQLLALSNYASVQNQAELRSQFTRLTDEELKEFCVSLDVRTDYPATAHANLSRTLLLDSLLYRYASSSLSSSIELPSSLPTESSLYDEQLLRNESYDGERPLALPKLNLQYLELNDFLWRSFILYRTEALYEIRKDIESTIKRMKPRPGPDRNTTVFGGFTKMGMPIEKPGITEVEQPKVGLDIPAFVRAEVVLDVRRMNDGVRHDWDSLRPGDVVFLVHVRTTGSNLLTNGRAGSAPEKDWDVARIRSAEVVQVLDESGRALRDNQQRLTNGYAARPQRRRLLLNIDAVAYKDDVEGLTQGRPDVYSSVNVLARRQRRENNFKPILDTVHRMASTRTELPSWFQDVFLGYGDPRSASYPELTPLSGQPIDFLDTFIDHLHLQGSFPTSTLGSGDADLPTQPPVVLQFQSRSQPEPPSNPRKRRRDQIEEAENTQPSIQVSTYSPANTGPYPDDQPNLNAIRFTPKQVEALVSAVHPGLTVVVGPPGTGKTDVAAQLIHLLTSNYPSERILLIAHSNQALNQLFQKITALDIDPRHLLRLGHGEEDLEGDESYSKFGRVESFLEMRQTYLAEVQRLANSIEVEGAHGSTCETAEYFYQVHIDPAWSTFWAALDANPSSTATIRKNFPFYRYFSNAPVPALFPENATTEDMVDVAKGCEHHIRKIFSELATIRPFEVLRHSRDQNNHLLVKEARVIAMTSTHAAMRRSEIASLGFRYDTLVMEEAAQVTEIESFIPCAMQNPDPKTGELPLRRLVLIGDHLQNSPVVQNMALRQYANYEQSMFLRLVRLGVPTVHLNQQGRCRPSIADLFRWRYSGLGDLPHIMSLPEFSRANAGFRYEYQFIDVPEYQGQGEREPSPHFIQNLGEAEYTVALYQYMRLLGYPAKSFSILTTYAGQKALIRDVLDHRCKTNRIFGLPRIVTTVDKYQGEQNDYVIVSMTRTRSIGYLRDVRRLTVLLSRARLGLYILGCRDLFETCIEMRPAMEMLMQRPDKLVLTTGEMFPTKRQLEEDVSGTEMEGVEHLGQYVYEMTQAKVKALGGQIAMSEEEVAQETYEGDAVDGRGDVVARVDDDDPLHENV